MAEVMYALRSQIESDNLKYGLYYIGKKDNINTILAAIETSTHKELSYLIVQEWSKIISKTGTEIMTFKKFPDMKISNVVRYYELTKKEQEEVIHNMFIAKETTVKNILSHRR